MFNGRDLFELADHSVGGTPRARSFPFVKHLNAIWRDGRTPVFAVSSSGKGARITVDRQPLLEILPGDAADPVAAGEAWANRVAAEFAARAAKGRQQ